MSRIPARRIVLCPATDVVIDQSVDYSAPMNKTTRFDTREHILTIGEQLCVQRGFNGTGLIELLKQAGVPKGSFYYYFPSKEAFGVALLERYFARYVQNMRNFFDAYQGDPRLRVLEYYRQAVEKWQEHDFVGCLSVKLSAEVCDLSEEMRSALAAGSSALITTLTDVLEKAQREGYLPAEILINEAAQTLNMLWMGASLHAKICRSSTPLETAVNEITRILRVA